MIRANSLTLVASALNLFSSMEKHGKALKTVHRNGGTHSRKLSRWSTEDLDLRRRLQVEYDWSCGPNEA